MQAITVLNIVNPEFSGQIKNEFNNPRLQAKLNTKFLEYFKSPEGSKFINDLCKKYLPVYQIRLREFVDKKDKEATKALDNFKKRATASNQRNDNLLVPSRPQSEYSKCFLIIVEGESGGSRLVKWLQTLDDKDNYFAIFKTRGNFINVLTNDLLTCNDRETYEKLINAIEKYNWKRIVSFTDGDVDGYKIRDQHANFVVHIKPELIFQHRFSILQSPLCKMMLKANPGEKTPNNKGYHEAFFFSKESIQQAEAKYGNRIVGKVPYKGIGALHSEDFRELFALDQYGNLKNEYIIDASSPTLKDEKLALNRFYGSDASYRKQYVEQVHMTERFIRYSATRRERFKDLGVNFNAIDKGTQAITTTESYIESANLQAEADLSTIRDSVYYSPVEFLHVMKNKYGADLNMLQRVGTEPVTNKL